MTYLFYDWLIAVSIYGNLIWVMWCQTFDDIASMTLACLAQCPDGLYCLRVAGILHFSDDLSPGVLWCRYIPYCCMVLLDCFCFGMVQDVHIIFLPLNCYLYRTLWSPIYISPHKVPISIE